MSASDLALDGIIQLLIDHVYNPGDWLYETLLAERLSLSRTPVKNALTQLVTCGFLEKTPHRKGYLVPILTPKDMQIVFQARAVLERTLAEQAAQLCQKSDIDVLRRLNSTERKAFEALDKKEYARCNEEFHFTLAHLADNPYLERYVTQIFWRSRLYDFFFSGFYNDLADQTRKNERQSCNEHEAVIDALEARDSENAGKAMYDHIVNAYKYKLLSPTEFAVRRI